MQKTKKKGIKTSRKSIKTYMDNVCQKCIETNEGL